MPGDAVIRAAGLGKKYVIGHETQRPRYTALRDVAADAARKMWRKTVDVARGRALIEGDTTEEFWALRDVNFEIQRGEVVGIIGRNGAGKSTLLKILSRITEPTEGRVEIAGRVASLLEVGTGFHPELSGRENIYLNGAILGMTRAEIRRKFDEIVDFAEIEKFLDTPVKRYSSGMYVRLAFAVAAHLEPEILLVDEVLAVGDLKFQNKCLGKIETIGKTDRTVILVSHNMQAIRRLSQRVMVFSDGLLDYEGQSDIGISRYLDQGQPYGHSSPAELRKLIQSFPPDPDCRLVQVGLLQDNNFVSRVESAKSLEVFYEYEVLRPTYGLHAYFRLFDSEGNLLFESIDCAEADEMPTVEPGHYRSSAVIPADFLAGRRYEFELGIAIAHGRYCTPQPIRLIIEVDLTGKMNQIFPGYVSPGRLLPAINWRSERSQNPLPHLVAGSPR